MPERPDILLTIFHLVGDSHLPMTPDEITRLIVDVDHNLNPSALFNAWRESGHLRKRRGRYYVLPEMAKDLLDRNIKPRLDDVQRTGWIVEHATQGMW
jgi:hypothetical protein